MLSDFKALPDTLGILRAGAARRPGARASRSTQGEPLRQVTRAARAAGFDAPGARIFELAGASRSTSGRACRPRRALIGTRRARRPGPNSAGTSKRLPTAPSPSLRRAGHSGMGRQPLREPRWCVRCHPRTVSGPAIGAPNLQSAIAGPEGTSALLFRRRDSPLGGQVEP
jgi:hypothetical protein